MRGNDEKVFKTHNPAYPFEYRYLDAQFDKIFKSETLIGKLAGIFSERDFARHAVEFNNVLNLEVPVRDLMTSPVYFIEPEQPVEDCMVVMTAKKLRHLPVLSEGKLVGMVSIGDVVKHMLADKQETIDVLNHFLWVNLI